MRLRAFLTLCMAALWGAMQGQNVISLSSGEGHPGDELTVSLSMNGSEQVSAIEAVIPLCEWLTYVDGSVALDPARSDGHQVSAATVDGSLRIYAYSLSLSNFKGSSGSLLTFKLRLGDTAGAIDLQPTVLLSNASGATLDVNATGCTATILSPMLEIATPYIDFGHVPIRSTYQSSLSLSNVGNEPLHISDILPDDSELSVSPTAITIPAGGMADVTVTYAPLRRVPFDASLSVLSDAVNAKIYGKWQAAKVVADPFSVNELYVSQTSGASDTEVTVGLRLYNMEPIVGTQVSFYLPDALRYVDGSASVTARGVNHQVMTSVEGGKLTIFAYSPDNTPFRDDDGEFLTFKLLLNGRNGWYWLQPQDVILSNAGIENMTSACYGEYVVIESPTIYGAPSLNFGNQPITEEMTATYTIGNSGQTALTVDRVTFLAEGFSVKSQLPIVIEPWQEAQLTIGYSTKTPGDFSTTMNVYSNDPEQRMMPVTISGAGYSPNELAVSGAYNALRTARVLAVSLCNESPLAALQFDVQASPAGAVNSAPIIGKTDRIASHDANVYDMGNGLWRVLVYSMTNQEINPSTGNLLTLTFDGMDDCTFTLQNTILSSMDGSNIESPELSAIRSYQFNNATSVDKLANEIVWEQAFEEVSAGDVIVLTAYATSGLPVTYEITKGSNLASLEGSTLTINGAGDIDVTASQAGDEIWHAAQPVTKTIVAIDGIICVDADSDGEVTVVSVQGYVIYHGNKADMPPLPHGVYITVSKNSKTKVLK